MARKRRLHYKGALYHVICRGNNREVVFKEDQDKFEYLNLIKKYKERHDFKLYAYCIMDNHVHMLIEVKDVPLSRIMQGIQQSYTQRYNIRHNRVGHVFEQRYKGILCDKEGYLFQLIRYIHYNPVKAGLEQGIHYKWSSHSHYLDYRSSRALIDSEEILKILNENKQDAVQIYLDIFNIKEELELKGYEKEYAKEIESNDLEKKRISLDRLIDIFEKKTGKDISELGKSKRRKEQKFKNTFILLAKEYGDCKNIEIAKAMRISQSSVSRTLAKMKGIEENTRELIEDLEIAISQA